MCHSLGIFPQTGTKTEKSLGLSRKTEKVNSGYFKSIFTPYFWGFPEAGLRMVFSSSKTPLDLFSFRLFEDGSSTPATVLQTKLLHFFSRQKMTLLPHHCLSVATYNRWWNRGRIPHLQYSRKKIPKSIKCVPCFSFALFCPENMDIMGKSALLLVRT